MPMSARLRRRRAATFVVSYDENFLRRLNDFAVLTVLQIDLRERNTRQQVVGTQLDRFFELDARGLGVAFGKQGSCRGYSASTGFSGMRLTTV